MAVLSKLLYEVMPKTVTGWVLCMVPIAAAAVLLMFPRAVVQALMPSESVEDVLGEEGEETIRGGAADRAKVAGKDAKRKRRPARSQKTPKKSEQARDEQVINVNPQKDLLDESLTEEENSLLQLVSLRSQTVSRSDRATQAKATIPQSPVLSVLSLSNEGDDEKWSRVPTKQEEAIVSLKSRITTITNQLEESEREVADLKNTLEKESARAKEAENELKDRSRSYQIRWVEMETEISNLKGAKEQLMKRLSESLSAQDVMLKQRDDIIASLKDRIAELEMVSASVPLLKKQVTGHEETEKVLREDISRLETKLSQALERDEQLKQERSQAEGKLQELQKRLDSLQIDREKIATEMSSLKEQLSQTMSSMTAAKEQAQLGQVSLDQKSEEIKKLKEELEDLAAVKNEVSKLLEVLKLKETEIDTLQDTLSKVKEEKVSLELTNSSANEREAAMAKELSQLKEAISDTQMQKDNLAAQLAAISDKDNQIAKLTLDLGTIEEERNRLRGDLEKIETETRELKERSNQENYAHLQAAEETKKEAEAKASNLQDEVAKLRTELAEITERLAVAEAQVQDKSTSSQEEDVVTTAISSLQVSLEASQRERLGLVTQLEQLERTLKQHQGDLERVEKKNSILQSVMDMKVSSLKEEINVLRNERDSLASKLAGFAQSTEMLDRLVDESSSTNPSKEDDSVSPAAVPSA